MSKYFPVIFAIILAAAVGAGCAGAKQKTTTTPTKQSDEAPPTALTTDSVSEEVVETGEGEGAPDQHEMSEDARGTYAQGLEAAKNGDLAKAEQEFKRVLKIDGKAHQAAYNLGVVAERQGDEEKAKDYYRQAFQLQPNYLPAISACANIYIRQGDMDKAIALLNKKATEFPKVTSIINKYADVLIEAERYNEAIKVAKQTLKLDERNADAMLRIGKANLRLKRYELAESIFGQVLKIDENKAEVYFLRAFIRLNEGLKQAAIEDFRLAIEKKSTYVEAMNNLATLYLLSGNYSDAIALLEEAIRLAPSWAVLQMTYGNALRGAGRWEDSKAALKKAWDLDSSLNGAIFNLGILYYVAAELDGMDRKSRLSEAKRLFAQYKSAMGSKLSKTDDVHKYLKEVQISIDREAQREKAEAERVKREAERAKAKEAEEKAAAEAKESGEEPAEKKEEPAAAGDEWY